MLFTDDVQLDPDGGTAPNLSADVPPSSVILCADGGPYPSLRFRRPRSPRPVPDGIAALLAFIDDYDDASYNKQPTGRLRAALRIIVAEAAAELEQENSKHWSDDRPRYWTELHGYQVMLRVRGTIAVRRIDEGYWPMEAFAWTEPNPRLLAHPVWRITRQGKWSYSHTGWST